MDRGGSNSFGTLSTAPDGRSVEHVYTFVTSTLAAWTSEEVDRSNSNENELTNELCRVLNQTKPAEAPYSFHHQNIEDANRNTSTDFAVFPNTSTVSSALSSFNTAIVKFEAKRLTAGLGTAREKEYVIGQYNGKEQTKNSGAIERFKNETHGKDVSNTAILAYVQRHEFSAWETKINGWITDEIQAPHDATLTWANGDLLTNGVVSNKVITYTSNSARLTQSPVTIKHIWVDLTEETKPLF